MGELKLSVIIPIYNSSKYMDKCIKSILNQTYTNLEIILIDDGSTDGSSEKCNLYKNEDNRVKIFHINNSGASHARNIGIDNASGDYITFVDSDDYVDKDTYENCMNIINNNAVKVLKYNHIEHKNGREYIKEFSYANEGFVDFNEIIEQFLNGTCNGYVWSLIIDKNVINGLRFDEKIKIEEDLLFSFELFSFCHKLYAIDKPYYHYVINADSITNSKDKLIKNFDEYINSYYKSLDLLKKIDCYNQKAYKKITTARYNHIIRWHIPKMIKAGYIDDAANCLCTNSKFEEIASNVDTSSLSSFQKIIRFFIIKKNVALTKCLLALRTNWLKYKGRKISE